MDNVAAEVLKSHLLAQKATAFQDALDKINSVIFGASFTQVKQKHDGGCDGIIEGVMVLAAYAPEKPNLYAFKKKIAEDHASYLENWKATHPKWKVIINGELTASMIQFVKGLEAEAHIVGIDGLIDEVRKQPWSKKNLIFKALGIPDHFLTNDVFGTIMEDLIQLSGDQPGHLPYSRPTYVSTKIELNLEPSNIDAFEEEYADCLRFFHVLQAVIRSHTPDHVFSLRSKIRNEYMKYSGTFSQRMTNMVESLCGAKFSDDYYKSNVRVVLIYFFEQCLFGRKTNDEVA